MHVVSGVHAAPHNYYARARTPTRLDASDMDPPAPRAINYSGAHSRFQWLHHGASPWLNAFHSPL